MFLLDTDVLSHLRKVKRHPRVVSWIEATGWEALGTTVVTVVEIQCGIERQKRSHPDYAGATQAWLDRLLEVGQPQVRLLTIGAALLLARMHETPALRGFVVPDPGQRQPRTAADLAIAAIAVTEGMVVATGNEKHFASIDACFPLPGLYNPFDGAWVRGGIME